MLKATVETPDWESRRCRRWDLPAKVVAQCHGDEKQITVGAAYRASTVATQHLISFLALDLRDRREIGAFQLYQKMSRPVRAAMRS